MYQVLKSTDNVEHLVSQWDPTYLAYLPISAVTSIWPVSNGSEPRFIFIKEKNYTRAWQLSYIGYVTWLWKVIICHICFEAILPWKHLDTNKNPLQRYWAYKRQHLGMEKWTNCAFRGIIFVDLSAEFKQGLKWGTDFVNAGIKPGSHERAEAIVSCTLVGNWSICVLWVFGLSGL